MTRFKVGDRVSPIIFQGHYHVSSDLLHPARLHWPSLDLHTSGAHYTTPAICRRATEVYPYSYQDEDVKFENVLHGLGGAIDGVASEYVTLSESDAVHIPKSWSYDQASTIPIAYATAWSSLYSHHAKLLPGQTVLCLGTGGVSLCAAQLALSAGARVILTSSSSAKLDRAAKELEPLVAVPGALETINYTEVSKWDEKVRELTDGRGVDFVIEIGGIGTLAKSVRSTRQGGLVAISGYLSAYETSKAVAEEDLAKVILYSAVNVRGVFVANRTEVEALTRALEFSRIKPIIDKVRLALHGLYLARN